MPSAFGTPSLMPQPTGLFSTVVVAGHPPPHIHPYASLAAHEAKASRNQRANNLQRRHKKAIKELESISQRIDEASKELELAENVYKAMSSGSKTLEMKQKL